MKKKLKKYKKEFQFSNKILEKNFGSDAKVLANNFGTNQNIYQKRKKIIFLDT